MHRLLHGTSRPCVLGFSGVGLAALLAATLTVGAHPTRLQAPAPAPAPMDAVLRRLASGEESASLLRVIVTLRDGDRRGLDQVLGRHGHAVVAELPLINAVTVEAHASELAAIAALPGVRSLSSDGTVRSASDRVEFNRTRGYRDVEGKRHHYVVPEEDGAPTQGLTAETTTASLLPLRDVLGIDGVRTSGSGIGVAVIDSGYQKNSDIEDVYAWRDFTPAARTKPYDDFGHGTHIAGIIKGKGDLSDGRHLGVASDTRIIALKVLDAQGQGDVTSVIAAIQLAVARHDSWGIDVINLSLGHPVYEPAATDPLVQAVEAAVRAGIAVVVSAGNHGTLIDDSTSTGYGGINSPGNAPSAITVGATDAMGTRSRVDDQIATFSSRGPTPYDNVVKPDLVAPGRRVLAPIPVASTLGVALADRLVCFKDCAYATAKYVPLSGTSMAAAVTSGAAAAVLREPRHGPRHVAAPHARGAESHPAVHGGGRAGCRRALTRRRGHQSRRRTHARACCR